MCCYDLCTPEFRDLLSSRHDLLDAETLRVSGYLPSLEEAAENSLV